jgi:hypothetical protein
MPSKPFLSPSTDCLVPSNGTAASETVSRLIVTSQESIASIV